MSNIEALETLNIHGSSGETRATSAVLDALAARGIDWKDLLTLLEGRDETTGQQRLRSFMAGLHSHPVRHKAAIGASRRWCEPQPQGKSRH